MAKIKLTMGFEAIVDDEDFDYLSQWKWHYKSGYAETQNNCKHFYMHRIINKTPTGLLTDHINRNKLDNRKTNLRTGDKRLNSINRCVQSNNTSGHRGISWSKQKNKWETYIWVHRNKILLGLFKNLDVAIKTRKAAEKIYYAV